MEKEMKGVFLFILLAALPFSSGCVKRTLLIESDPPGAKVWINEHSVGVTPVKYEFITHGRYLFRLRKGGFREVIAREMVRAPVYEWIPLDFFFENLLPLKLEDKHSFAYALSPQPPDERMEIEGPEDVRADVAGLQDPDPRKRRAAAYGLAKTRDPSIAEEILPVTRDADPNVRKTALHTLRAVKGKEASPRLIEALGEDANPEVRWQAAVELEALKDTKAIPALTQALKDKDPLVRAGAAEALNGVPDPRSVAPLIAALRDKDTTARRSAAEALGKIGDRSAVKPLIRVLFHHDFQTRRRAAKSLAQLNDPAAALPLARSLDNWDPKLRKIAGDALLKMPETAPVVPLLIRYLHSWKPVTRQEAATVLGGLKDSRALKPLMRAFRREPNHATSHAMLIALKELGMDVGGEWERIDSERARKAEQIQQLQEEEEKKPKDPNPFL